MELPRDLIPYKSSMLKLDWVKETYHYCRIFDDSVIAYCYESNEDLANWTRTATNVSEYLKAKGTGSSKDECVFVFG
eukprot:9711697-Ditylum_brightwellii.AAC.1